MGRQPDSDSKDSDSDSNDNKEPPELMGRPPNTEESYDLDDKDMAMDKQGWRPSYSDSEDDKPQQKSYHAERC
jgi:hypothetical protein